MTDLKDIKNKYLTSTDEDALGITTNTDRVSFLSRKLSLEESLNSYSLVNSFSDSFGDTSGINTGSSTYYRGTNFVENSRSGSNYFGDGSLGNCTFGSSGITQTSNDIKIDTILETGLSTEGPGVPKFELRDTNAYELAGNTALDNSSLPQNTIYGFSVKNSSTDNTSGDMVVLNFKDLTIDSGVCITPANPCRGMLVYVDGDLTVNGNLSMTGRGGNANPTTAGGSDSSAVSATGLRLGLFTSSGTDTLASADFAGCGNEAVSAVANQPAISSNGTIFTVSQLGGTGGAGGYASGVSDGGDDGSNGSTGSATISTGGGGGGSYVSGWATDGRGGAGGRGGAFSAGAGGGSTMCRPSYCQGENGGDYGGKGGNTGAVGGSMNGWGGAGNMEGQGWFAEASAKRPAQDGKRGVGGLLWVIVNGDVTIGASGTIEAEGTTTLGNYGGASGGGAIFVLYSGTLTNSGSISAAGGDQSASSIYGGNGGDGGTHTAQISAPVTTNNFTLISSSQTAISEPTSISLSIEFEKISATVSINTDIVASVSRDGGTTYSTITLSNLGDYETGKQIFSGKADVSGQPSGTSLVYKIVNANNKQFKVRGATMSWS